MTRPEHWPLRDLVLRTPRLELRPDDDPGLFELVEVAYRGVHPPEEMPFATPWTDADPAYLGRGALQYFWSQRAELAPDRWSVHFLVRVDGGRAPLILDPFGGAGTTLIAAEKTGRRACLIEIDPRYVDVTITPWQNLTRRTACPGRRGNAVPGQRPTTGRRASDNWR